MKLQILPSHVNVWLSSRDTYNWASRPGESWPCSQLSGSRLFAQFDHNGLVDLTVDGKSADIDANEFNACIADHLRNRLSPEHPCHFVVVEQFA